LWEAVQQVEHVLAVHTVDAASRVVSMLGRDVSIDDMLFPPPFSVERALAGEPAEPADPWPNPGVVLVDEPPDGDRCWLALGAEQVTVRTEPLGPMTRRAVAAAAEHLLAASHVLVEAMRPLLGVTDPTTGADGWDPYLGRADADELARSGRRVGLLFHGSEVRRPEVHAHLTPWSPFGHRAA